MVAVAPAVQDLQGDAAAGSVDRISDLAVLGRLGGAHQGGAMGGQAARPVGADAARDDEAGSAFGPLSVEPGQLGEAARLLLEPHVHGPHDGAVGHPHA